MTGGGPLPPDYSSTARRSACAPGGPLSPQAAPSTKEHLKMSKRSFSLPADGQQTAGTPSPDPVAFSPEAIQDIASHVHTYESFGRAIVSHVLRSVSAGEGPLERRSVGARFSIRPEVARKEAHCITIDVTIDESTYSIGACVTLGM
jgi:hypothetical protein